MLQQREPFHLVIVQFIGVLKQPQIGVIGIMKSKSTGNEKMERKLTM